MSVKGIDIFNDLLADGWQRNPDKPDEIFDPKNPELRVRLDSHSDSAWFSPPLIELLRDALKRRGHDA